MEKIRELLIVLIVVLGASQVKAQAYDGLGDQKVQGGLSIFGNGLGLQSTYDYGIFDIFSLGGGLELYFRGTNGNKQNKAADFYLFGRASVHLGRLINMPSEMDLYPGIDLGFLGGNAGLGGHLGYRYFFTPKYGAYVELGTRGSIGITINL